MVFTALLWLLSLIIFLSDRHSKTNRWCAVSGLIFSLGPFKEFLFYEAVPPHLERLGNPGYYALAENIYSFMTAALYDFVMPCLFIFALYFYEYHLVQPKRFRIFKILALCLPLPLMLLFPPLATRELQHTSLAFWYGISVYNLTYGVLATVLMIKAVLCEKWTAKRREKRRVVLVVLPPVWFWLITIFVIHSLRVETFFKAWQGNAYLLGAIVLFYIVAVFREGMMGIRLRGEQYKWDGAGQSVDKGARYTSHILKNEVTKIEWCMENLTAQLSAEAPEELKIIGRSTEHLKHFVHKTQLYSNDILLEREPYLVKDLIESAIDLCREYAGAETEFDVLCGGEVVLCDRDHITEVLNNLISNAADAMNRRGTITFTFEENASRRYQALHVQDTGCGIPRENLRRLFEPYFSTKMSNSHFGLGLAYCFNIMKLHNGYIDVQSGEGEGAVFSLYFPRQRRRAAGGIL
ncbi:MAG TPA: HAMP domain-containing sensor histidine kinase [Feifaniaceae bacterium]|nr:HAMP domain-containing sensor histidine kinase [Feifaniaceae bacterium]